MGPLFGVSCIESTMFFGSNMAKGVCVHKMLQHFGGFFNVLVRFFCGQLVHYHQF